MKLLFIFTGGTIGSTLNGEYISTDSSKPYKLLDEYNKKYGIDFEYDAIQPYTELSENNTGSTIRALCECVCSNLTKEYDGIIVTHGTDTLQYTSAALGYVIGNDSIPVCLVSSNYPIEHPKANGIENLRGAIRFIELGNGRGVFVSYKNPDDTIKIHRGTRLIASQAYSDSFYSIYDTYYGSFDDKYNFTFNPDFSESTDQATPLPYSKLNERSNEILRLESYVGMAYPELNAGTRYILLGSYHSGTTDTKSDTAKEFFKRAYNLGIKVYITGVSRGADYESTKLFDDLHISSLPEASPIAMYIKLWLCEASGIDFESVADKSVGGDII